MITCSLLGVVVFQNTNPERGRKPVGNARVIVEPMMD